MREVRAVMGLWRPSAAILYNEGEGKEVDTHCMER